ncbi:hypothetical protein DFH09DRAFT_1346828 [Mycena vulgaris]|nr:hypothetical protein DFH09DRAFT_1346828 [Mycena vulgaris]
MARKSSTKSKGLWRHAPFYKLPIREKPLSSGMIQSLSAYAKPKLGSKRFYTFPTSSQSAEAMWVSPRGNGYDYKDFDLRNVFPNGCISVHISILPGTDMALPSAWRVYIDNGRYPAPSNACIQHKFNVDWPGNIVLVKHRRRSDHIAQVAYGEEDYADVILGLWLKEFMHVNNALGFGLDVEPCGGL